jgi:hypothetical protein
MAEPPHQPTSVAGLNTKNVWIRSRIIDLARVSFGRIEGSASRWQGKIVAAHSVKRDVRYVSNLSVVRVGDVVSNIGRLDTTGSDR